MILAYLTSIEGSLVIAAIASASALANNNSQKLKNEQAFAQESLPELDQPTKDGEQTTDEAPELRKEADTGNKIPAAEDKATTDRVISSQAKDDISFKEFSSKLNCVEKSVKDETSTPNTSVEEIKALSKNAYAEKQARVEAERLAAEKARLEAEKQAKIKAEKAAAEKTRIKAEKAAKKQEETRQRFENAQKPKTINYGDEWAMKQTRENEAKKLARTKAKTEANQSTGNKDSKPASMANIVTAIKRHAAEKREAEKQAKIKAEKEAKRAEVEEVSEVIRSRVDSVEHQLQTEKMVQDELTSSAAEQKQPRTDQMTVENEVQQTVTDEASSTAENSSPVITVHQGANEQQQSEEQDRAETERRAVEERATEQAKLEAQIKQNYKSVATEAAEKARKELDVLRKMKKVSLKTKVRKLFQSILIMNRSVNFFRTAVKSSHQERLTQDKSSFFGNFAKSINDNESMKPKTLKDLVNHAQGKNKGYTGKRTAKALRDNGLVNISFFGTVTTTEKGKQMLEKEETTIQSTLFK